MLKRLGILLFSICAAQFAWSQQISQAEYFIDTDPGVGNGSSIVVSAGDTVLQPFTLPTAGVAPGFHNLWVRTQNSIGVWSITTRAPFYVNDTTHINATPPAAPQISSAEYFVDTDPGQGNGTALTVSNGDIVTDNISLSTAGLSIGFHNLWVRSRNTEGVWSHSTRAPFYVNDTSQISIVKVSPQIVGAEYFVDTDPGQGNGTSIAFSQADTVTHNFGIDVSPYNPGNHIVFIRTLDENGVWSHHDSAHFVLEILPLDSDIDSVRSVSCNAATDGWVDGRPIEGLPPHTLEWWDGTYSNVLGTDTLLENIGAGLYHFVVTDANGDKDTSHAVVTQPNLLVAQNTIISATCGGNMGSIGAVVLGGTTPYSYVWNTGATTSGLNNLTSNTYTVSVTDANGCFDTSATFVPNAGLVELDIIGDTILCNNGENGQIQLSVSNSTPPYTFSWNNGSVLPQQNNLSVGEYSVTVIDANGCIGSTVTEVTAPPAIEVFSVVNTATCGQSNGNVSIGVSGGVEPYTYAWTNGSTATTVDSLFAGVYGLNVVDSNNCQTTRFFNVSDGNGPTIVVNDVSSVVCPGDGNGAIDVTIFGGNAPYEVNWSNGETSHDLQGLNPGPYEIEVEDAIGCVAIASVNVPGPQPLSPNPTLIPASCGGSGGAVVLNPTGGTQPYTYLWSNGSTDNALIDIPAQVLSAVVTDDRGCSKTFPLNVNEVGAPNITNVPRTGVSCGLNNGTANAIVFGGEPPYSYNWNSGQTTRMVTGLSEGEYTLTVTGANGCKAYKDVNIGPAGVFADPICLVSVDTLTHTNLIAWEKQGTGISQYNIYRESSQTNVYQLVGSVPIDSVSMFTDSVADPTTRSWKYKISMVDTCGIESELSEAHKTMHLTVNLGLSGSINLLWDHYMGFNFNQYVIWRYADQTNWVKIDSLASNLTSYTDTALTGMTNLNYFIEVVHPDGCQPTLNKASNFNSSRSNRPPPIAAPVTTVENPPVADLQASLLSIYAGDNIDFTDMSTNTPTDWFWVFSGGTPSISDDQNPMGIVYNNAGMYDVTLIASNIDGSDTLTISNYITVIDTTGGTGPAPAAALTASSTTINQGETIDFMDGSSNTPNGWLWVFEGGDPSVSSQKNPAGIMYAQPGVYDVTLVVSNDFGSDTLVYEDYITVQDTAASGVAPFAGFSETAIAIDEGQTIDFTDISTNNPTSWFWFFSGGSPSISTNQNPSNVTYNSAGIYDVTLIASNVFGSDTITKTNHVTVNPVVNGLLVKEKESQVNVYPNPNSGSFVIETGVIKSVVQITDLAGKLVYSSKLNKSQAVIALDLARGTYLIEVKTDSWAEIQKLLIH